MTKITRDKLVITSYCKSLSAEQLVLSQLTLQEVVNHLNTHISLKCIESVQRLNAESSDVLSCVATIFKSFSNATAQALQILDILLKFQK